MSQRAQCADGVVDVECRLTSGIDDTGPRLTLREVAHAKLER